MFRQGFFKRLFIYEYLDEPEIGIKTNTKLVGWSITDHINSTNKDRPKGKEYNIKKNKIRKYAKQKMTLLGLLASGDNYKVR